MDNESDVQPRPEFEVRKTVFPDEPEGREPESPTEETNGTNGGLHEEAAPSEDAVEPAPILNESRPEEPMDVNGETSTAESQPEANEPAEPKLGIEDQPAEPVIEDQPAEPVIEDQSTEPVIEDQPDEPEPKIEDDTEAQPEVDDKPEVGDQPVEAKPEDQPEEMQTETEEKPVEPDLDDAQSESPAKMGNAGTDAAPEAGPSSAFDDLMSENKRDGEDKKEIEKTEEQVDDLDADVSAEKPDEEKRGNEVFDVEDDGKVIPTKPKLMADAEYFAGLDSEELEWYKEHVQDHNKKLLCTSCFKQINAEINAHSGVFRHPMLGVVICKACQNYYDDGEWTKDEEGFDMFCRWCGQGGDIMICDKCPHAFCKKCLQRNLGRKFVSEISSSEEWKCLVCDPKQIYELRALYYELYINQKDILEKKLKRQEEQAKRRSSVSATPKKTEKPAEEAIPEAPEMIFSSDNFLEDNFGEAMKTLTDFQTLMEEEQNRWNEASKVLDPEIATSITRKLRKFYNATKQSMEVLDRALATAYVSKYPEEAKRIHLGKDDEVIDAETEYGNVKKRQPKMKKKPVLKKVIATPKKVAPAKKKKILPKKKVLVEKKKAAEAKASAKAPAKAVAKKPAPKPKAVAKPGPKSSKSAKSYVTPSLMAAMAKKKPTKVSANLFKGKKRPAAASNDSDESDIEILEEVEQSPPPAKKPKIGPKSKTRV